MEKYIKYFIYIVLEPVFVKPVLPNPNGINPCGLIYFPSASRNLSGLIVSGSSQTVGSLIIRYKTHMIYKDS